MSMPRVILFDLDDTLFAHRAAVDQGIREYAATLGAEYATFDGGTSRALWNELEERHYHSYLAGTLNFEGQRRARARDYAAAHGVTLTDDLAGAWFDDYFAHYVSSWVLHDDSLPCLDALATAIPGVRFGIITNGELAFQTQKILAVGLVDRVENVITSGEFGIAKPDARIFRHACDVFGVRTDEAVYIGDRLRTDAIGAALAGLTGVWLNRTGRVPDADERQDAATSAVLEIRGLYELPAMMTGPSAGMTGHWRE